MRVLSAGDPIELGDEDLVIEGDNLDVLPRLPDGAFDLIYIDPPFNTGVSAAAPHACHGGGRSGRRRSHGLRRASLPHAAAAGARVRRLVRRLPRVPRARASSSAHRLLAPHGTLYFHIDYREAHYCKLLLDECFGRDAFLNEIIWAYDYGAKPRNRWPAKHDTILVYVRTPGGHHFDADAVDREPYMAPGLVTPEKAARGKRPTDVWWHTIVPTNGAEKTGYPTQKPEGIVRRMVAASSRPGGWCLDFFAGSGTLGAVAAGLGRRYVLVDSNPEAIAVMRRRLG